MINQFSRTQLLLGKDAMEKLNNANVIVFGVGGVGGYVVEALVRSGIGKITIVDNDVISLTNINRQIIATHDTIGKLKVEVMKERILSINPNCQVTAKATFFLPENSDEFDFAQYDYVIDAIDTVKAKIEIVEKAYRENTPVICSMGTGNKLNPNGFVVTDISKTEMDPLAKIMRHELRKRGINHLKVVYSKEKPLSTLQNEETTEEVKGKRFVPGSTAFVPPAAGLLIASEVVKDLISK